MNWASFLGGLDIAMSTYCCQGCKDSREAKTTAETLCQEVSKEAQDGFRSPFQKEGSTVLQFMFLVGVFLLQHWTTVLLTFGLNKVHFPHFHSTWIKINIPVAFCEVLMGSDISLPWVHLALTLPRMQLGRTSMIEQINSPKLHCVRKTKQVCFANAMCSWSLTDQFCPHNETVAVLQDLPLQYSNWVTAKQQQEVLNSRVKREDIEGPGELPHVLHRWSTEWICRHPEGCSLHATGLLLVVLSHAIAWDQPTGTEELKYQ